MKRRHFLLGSAALGTVGFAPAILSATAARGAEGTFPVALSEDAWRKKLSADQFAVLRLEGTERPFTSALNENKKHGLYHCAGCDTALYSSDTKFDSGTGWPSFYAAIDGAIGNTTDYKLVYPRTEEHCATCGGHLGHVFDDGPPPTGKRHCINGVVLNFREGSTSS